MIPTWGNFCRSLLKRILAISFGWNQKKELSTQHNRSFQTWNFKNLCLEKKKKSFIFILIIVQYMCSIIPEFINSYFVIL